MPRTLVASPPWLNATLAAAAIALVVTGILLIGPPSTPAAPARLQTAVRGVIQSTVSGAGTVQSISQVGVGFASSGKLAHVYVKVGDRVHRGQLLADIDPTTAQMNLVAAQSSLHTAQQRYLQTVEGLTPQQVNQDNVAVGQSQAGIAAAQRALNQTRRLARSDAAGARLAVRQARTGLARAKQAAAADATSQQQTVAAANRQRGFDQQALAADQAQQAADQNQLQADTNQQTTDQNQANPDQNKISADKQAVASDQNKISSDQAKISADQSKLIQDDNSIAAAQNAQASAAIRDQQSIDAAANALANSQQSQSAGVVKDAQSLSQAQTSLTSARQALASTLAANAVKAQPPLPGDLASAQAAVVTAQQSLTTARQALTDTRLYAPQDGVVASVSNAPGETVSGTGGGGSGSSSSAGTGSSSSSSGGSAAGGSSAGGGGTGSSSGSGSSSAGGSSSSSAGSSSSSGSGFIVLTDLQGLQVAVPFSESDAVKVRLGQPATVSLDALPTTKLAAHVVSVSPTATTNSGVVSYNAVLELDQLENGLRPGMTATAQVVVAQVEDAIGISSAALSRAGGGTQTVNVMRGKRKVAQPVVTGLQGDNLTQIVSGLNAGDQVVIPTVSGLGSAAAGSAGTRAGGGTAIGLGGGPIGGGPFGGGGFGGGGRGG